MGLVDNLQVTDLIILDGLLVLIVLFFMFKWFFKQVRSIAREPEGFIKFGQTAFILLSWSVFFILLFYYIFNPYSINVLNVFLTIVVGFLGTILGLFFSREMIEKLKGTVERRSKSMLDQLEFLADVEKLIKENVEQKAKIEELEKKLGRR
ncbi:MAG: hypothetical protein AABX34_05010 [Nanoarchaeota archaeon]